NDNAIPTRLINRLEMLGKEQLEIPPDNSVGVVPPPKQASTPPQPPPVAAAPQAPPAPKPAPAAPKPAPAPVVDMGPEAVPLTADASLLAEFISESKEHLDAANNQLLALETEPNNKEALNSVFRAFHTMKGISGFLSLEDISH